MGTLHGRSLTSAAIGAMTIAWIACFFILLASLSLLRRKTAKTEKIGGHNFCSFIKGCHCVGSRAKMM